ncbi:MAG TPA: hypothetical protein VMV89_12625 [Candidatus Paceibacterota bacterium]|nr:hypothetical protein [Candidatus Paceibacterota bacterium]
MKTIFESRDLDSHGGIAARSLLECGGQMNATPLSDGNGVHSLFATLRPKAVSPLRSAIAVQKLARVCVVLFCFFILHSSFCLRASGQTYSIDWHKIAGGGGTSSGGVYSVTGTIGQHDAGQQMSGGNYSLTGGFWSLISVVQTSGAPTLYITRSGSTVTVVWENVPVWKLQENDNLATPGGWTVNTSWTTINGTNYLNIASPTGNSFFRLMQ